MKNQQFTGVNNGKRYRYTTTQKKNNKYMQKECSIELTEQDFYPPSDDRIWTSNIEDIKNGDNFADYCKDFFKLLDEEEYYDNK